MMMLAAGTALYAIGFGMYGIFSTYIPFVVAMLVITFGEMLEAPTCQALVVNLAPEDMRGRYLAVFGLGWMIPEAFGPFLAGIVMDNADSRVIWYVAMLVGFVGAGVFVLLQQRTKILALEGQ